MKHIARLALLALSFAFACHVPCAVAAAAPVDPMPGTVVSDHCSWDRPGLNPFMGDLVAAVDRYTDIPSEVRARLKARMEKREYDDLVSIRRDSIEGRGGYDYGKTISDMHFGANRLCHSVTRAAWSPQMQERGLVYCEDGHCLLVPTVCRNVSRITRRGVGPDSAQGPGSPLLAAAETEPSIDWFGAAGAGPAPQGEGLESPGEGPVSISSTSELSNTQGGFVTLGGFSSPTSSAGTTLGSSGVAGGGNQQQGSGYASTLGAPRTAGTYAAPVPEPATWSMVLLGLAGTILGTRKTRAARPSRL